VIRYTIEICAEPMAGFAPAWSAAIKKHWQDRSLSPSSHVGKQHEREESNLVWRLWRPSALPGARSCDVGVGPTRAAPARIGTSPT